MVDPYLSTAALARRVRTGEVSSVEATETCLQRIDARDGEVNAYVTVTGNRAREAAAAVERERPWDGHYPD